MKKLDVDNAIKNNLTLVHESDAHLLMYKQYAHDFQEYVLIVLLMELVIQVN